MGGGYNRRVRRAANRSAVVAAGIAAALAWSGCNGGTDTDRPLERRPLTAEDRVVERTLVGEAELQRTDRGSVERAFLDYWAALGHEEWSLAVQYLSSDIRRAFQPEHVPAMLTLESQRNVPVKPLVRGRHTVAGQTAVRYFIRSGDGRLRPTSIAWVHRREGWYITYSPTLDVSYAGAVQQAVQQEIDPRATAPSRQSLRAGAKAARAQAAASLTPTSRPQAGGDGQSVDPSP